MKTINKSLVWLAATVLSLTLISGSQADTVKQRTGKVVRIKGLARYSTGNKVWQPLKVGAILRSGTVVQTSTDSYVDIVLSQEETAATVVVKPVAAYSASSSASGGGGGLLPAPDQDVIRVLDDSYLVFDSLSASDTGADTVTETLLDLKRGSIFGTVKKQAATSRYEVKIPNGVAGIRGTIFMISANGNIACLQGSVVAAHADANGNVVTKPIGAGQQYSISSGVLSFISTALNNTILAIAQQCSYSSGGPGGLPGGGGSGHGHHDHGPDIVSPTRP
ncbi:MAG: FecR domain-containing protein [Verrucomicrobiae bacterium]|nr:FecR domain-containing protein [Verrucomicrobiae bacterium]